METFKDNIDNKKITPAFFFLNIGMMIGLLVSLVSLINLVFKSFDQIFPDILSGSYSYGYNTSFYEPLRNSIATLIIFFPVFLLVLYFFNKYNEENLSKNNLILRKWSIYIILFLAILTSIIDLSILVNFFIKGEITQRFILKVFSVIIISSITFFYYYNLLRFFKNKYHNLIFLSIALLFFIFSLYLGFSVLGSPKTQRNLQLDQRRVEDLQNIQSQVISFWQERGRLPSSLEEVISPIRDYQVLPKDPEFTRGLSYQYEKKDDKKFKLCATFSLDSNNNYYTNNGGREIYQVSKGYDISYPGNNIYSSDNNWKHLKGLNCFDREIDEKIYPIFDSREN